MHHQFFSKADDNFGLLQIEGNCSALPTCFISLLTSK